MKRWLWTGVAMGVLAGAGCRAESAAQLDRFVEFMEREGVEGRLIGRSDAADPGWLGWEAMVRMELYARPGMIVRAYKFPDHAWARRAHNRAGHSRIEGCRGGGRIGCYVLCQETAEMVADDETTATMGRVLHSTHFDAEALGCPPEAPSRGRR